MMVIEELSAQRNQDNQNILKHFIPLNALSSARLDEISSECAIEECAKGDVLFEQGDKAEEFVYLISGMLGLYKDEMEAEVVVTGSETARFAIAHHSPRAVKAVANSKAKIIRIPARMLDTNQPAGVDEVGDQAGDWMMTMLQSPVFQRLPASNLQKVMMKMEEIVFEAGDVVVKQGDEADYYYIIKSGDCELIRQPEKGAKPVKLAELHSCEAFGEDALLSGNPRNVTVRMKGKGQMLRLSKADFISLVKEPVLQYVSFEEAKDKVTEGASWLDVRSVESYEKGSIENSVNIPFFSLRMKIAELKHDQLQVLVCEKGRTSEAAAFLLLKFGFNAVILKGGMNGVTPSSVNKTNLAPPVKDELKPKLELVNTGNQDELVEDKGALSVAQAKIVELEKFGADLNEKLSNLELKRSDLQQQNGELEELVSGLRESTKRVTDEFDAKNLGEKERSSLLTAELEQKAKELDSAMQEVEESKALERNLKLELTNVTGAADKDITQNAVELEESKKELGKQEEQIGRLEKELLQLRSSDSDKEALLQEKQERIDASSGVVNELEKEVLSLKDCDAANKEKHREQQLTIDTSVSTIDDLSAQLASLQEQQEKAELLASEVLKTVTSERDKLKVNLINADVEMACLLVDQKSLQEGLDASVESLKKSEGQEDESKAAVSQLETERSQATVEIERLTEEAKDLRSSLLAVTSGQETQESELIKALEKAEKGVAESERKMELATKENSDREKVFAGELSDAKEEMQVAVMELQEMESAKVTLEKEIESQAEQLEQVVSDFSEKEKEFSIELRSAKESEGAVELSLQSAESEKGTLELELQRLGDKLKGAGEERTRLIEQLEELSLAVKKGGEEEAVSQREKEAFEGKEAALLSEVDEMKAELAESNRENENLKAEVGLLEQGAADTASYSKEVEGMKEELAESNRENENLKAEVGLLEQGAADTADQSKEVEGMKEELAESNRENENLKAEVGLLEQGAADTADQSKEVEGMKKELAESNRENENLKAEVGLLEQNIADTANQSKEVDNSALSALQSELDLVREQTEADVQFMQEKVGKSEKMNQELKAKIQSMQTLAGEDALPAETEAKEKKKGWW